MISNSAQVGNFSIKRFGHIFQLDHLSNTFYHSSRLDFNIKELYFERNKQNY